MEVQPAPYRLAAPVQREVAIHDGRTVYLAGGLDSSDVSASGVFALNPATGRLASLGSMTDAFHDGAGAIIGGKLFVFGGGTVSGTDVVQAFDPASHSSAVVGHLPVSLSDLSAVTVGNTTYLVGGYDGHAPRRESTPPPMGRRSGSWVACRRRAISGRFRRRNDLVIAGGRAANGPVDTVTAFDTANGTISSSERFLFRSPRHRPSRSRVSST